MTNPDANASTMTLTRSASTLILLIKQLRPKQWAKNLIVFTPLLFSHNFTDVKAVLLAALCFVSFCLIASSVYIFNDIKDVEADRLHPVKKNRPIASGRLNINLARAVAFFCLVGGLLISYAVRPTVSLALISYVVLNIFYTIKLKSVPIIDVFCIAAFFVIRAVSGAFAIHVPPSSWFLLCTTLGALYIGLEKRRQELKVVADDAIAHRKVLSDYSPALLARMEGVIVPSLVTAYAFYTFQSPQGSWMMLTVPIVLYGVLRYQMLSERGTSTGAPEEVFWRDRPTQITLVLWLATCAFVIYGNPQASLNSLARDIDSLSLPFSR